MAPRFAGRQGRGALRKYRQDKQIAAELRNEEYQARRKAADELTRLDQEMAKESDLEQA
jgi:hypothetical protein